MCAKHDKYSLTTDKSQRFCPCLSFSCKYWGIFAKHYNMCESFLYLPGSQKATRHFHGEVPAMKDVNSVLTARYMRCYTQMDCMTS